MSTFNMFTNQAQDGESSVYKVRERSSVVEPEMLRFHAFGNWAGASVELQVSLDGEASPSDWKLKRRLSKAGETSYFYLPSGAYIRAVMVDAGSPAPSITVQVVGELQEL